MSAKTLNWILLGVAIISTTLAIYFATTCKGQKYYSNENIKLERQIDSLQIRIEEEMKKQASLVGNIVKVDREIKEAETSNKQLRMQIEKLRAEYYENAIDTSITTGELGTKFENYRAN